MIASYEIPSIHFSICYSDRFFWYCC